MGRSFTPKQGQLPYSLLPYLSSNYVDEEKPQKYGGIEGKSCPERYTQIITEFYKKKTARDLKKLTAAMEPLMLVLAAGFIILLFFGFIMPIYQSIMSLSDMGVAQ